MFIDIVAGARPNFMKIAPIIKAINKSPETKKKLPFRLVHTGQHYDKQMSESFFKQLGLDDPDINLSVGSGTHAEQTSAIMKKYETLLMRDCPKLCIVVGDVNSTLACSIVAKKFGIEVAHVEGGIRSGDLNMPEEINRIITDSITDWFFTTSIFANDNLLRSGVDRSRIFFVGNTMIDTLLANMSRLKKPKDIGSLGVAVGNYLVLTLHRPSNVDDLMTLRKILDIIDNNCKDRSVVFPAHPRTREKLSSIEISSFRNLKIIEPQPYLEFNWLVNNSIGVITDSGGITEETTVLNIPCITIRDTTERPETVSMGSNELIGSNLKFLEQKLLQLVEGTWKTSTIPPLWDGHAGERIVRELERIVSF
ncbi:MAG: UDP-N-acetylglucosamine 2-epimerase (non-hydrolyzing) [Candidatus Endolissoclinum sp. TMED37]|nr:MAG: UDP-N-acetylglucosamine 2-epimerase (non-hydrolyzing) [Candidatus Endolissoclinum sp. TMED37]